MARKTAVFNGAVRVASGLALSYSRPHAITTAAGGTLAASNKPRFSSTARPVLDVPTPITLFTDGSATNMVFGGVWTDGITPTLVVWNDKSSPNASKVKIFVDPPIANDSLNTAPTRTLNIRCTGADLGGNKNNQVDLLRTSIDEEPDWVYAPYGGFTIVQGQIIAVCTCLFYHTAGTASAATVTSAVDTAAGSASINLRVSTGTATVVIGDTFTIAGQSTVYKITAGATLTTGGVAVSISPPLQAPADGSPTPVSVTVAGNNWQARATGFCYWDEANTRWRKMFRGPSTQFAQIRGREWLSAQYWPIDDLPLEQSLEVFCCYADYRVNPFADGGQFFACRLSRASSSLPFTRGPMALLFQESGVTSNCHAHNFFCYRDGANGVTFVGLYGDGNEGECFALHCSSSADYATGFDGSTPMASVNDGVTQNGYTTYRQRAGCPARLGNTPSVGWAQPMGVARWFEGGPRAFILGNDEGNNAIYTARFPEYTGGQDLRPEMDAMPYQPVSPPSMRRGQLAFGVWSKDPSRGACYAAKARRNSSSQSSISMDEVQRITFSTVSGVSGTFTITRGANTTGAIAWDNTPATLNANIDAALEALAGMGAGTVGVSGTSTTRDIQFTGSQAKTAQVLMTINTGSLTGATATISRIRLGKTYDLPVSWSPGSGDKLQGFASNVADENTRILYSEDGQNWGMWFSPNADVRPCWCGDYFITGGIAAYGKIVAWRKPTAFNKRNPMITSSGVTQRLITPIVQAEAPAANNTFTLVNQANLGVAGAIIDGQTIPKAPCNGEVYRWTVSSAATKYGGVYRLTSDTSLLDARYVAVKLWVYPPKPSNPFNDIQVPPFNLPRGNFRGQLLRAGSGQAMYAAAGDFDSVDAAGWTPFTIYSNTTDWAEIVAGSQNLAIRFTDPDASGSKNMDIFIAFESVTIESTPTDAPAHPLPVSAASIAAPGSIDHDYAVVGGIAPATTWTIATVQIIPESVWDNYVRAVNIPTAPFFTLWESPTRKITVRPDVVNRRVVITDGTNTLNLAPPAGYEWVFEHGTPVVLAIAVNGTSLEVSGSVGNTPLNTGTLTLAQTVRPTELIFADNSRAPVLAMEQCSVLVDDTQALNATDRAAMLNNISAAMASPSSGGGGGSAALALGLD